MHLGSHEKPRWTKVLKFDDISCCNETSFVIMWK